MGKITVIEFKERLMRTLRARNYTDQELEDVEKIFMGDLYEDYDRRGIDEKELKERFKWMRANKSKHSLDSDELDELESEMKKYL